MPSATKELRTETGHRLTNYDGRCSHLHGHSYLWQVTAKSHKLDDKNMVIDFKDLKKAMNAVLDPLDHCMVLAEDDPLWGMCEHIYNELSASPDDEVREGEKEALHGMFKATNGADPRLIKWHENPTAESFAKWALEQVQHCLGLLWLESMVEEHKDVESFDIANHTMPYFISSVKVWETATSYAEAQAGEG